MKPPRLLHFRVSHFNEKIRWALDYKGIPHYRHTLVPGFHIPTARYHTGQNKTPILLFDDLKLAGSDKILEELEKRHPTPPLYPASPEERKQVVEIQNYFDKQVAPEVRILFWSCYLHNSHHAQRVLSDGASKVTKGALRVLFPVLRPIFRKNIGVFQERVQKARNNMDTHLEYLEKRIGPTGHLVGSKFSAADLTAAAVMTALVRPPEFSYPLPQPYPDEFVQLRTGYSERKGWQWTMDTYARHRGKSFEIRSER